MAFLNKSQLKLLKRYRSPISGTIDIRETKEGEKRMMMNYYTQGISTNIETVKESYWYKAAEIALECTKDIKNPEIMTIGLGANTVPNIIAQTRPDVHQTLIEIDPLVVAACKEYFELQKLPNHTLIESDIYKLLENSTYKQSQDVILVDILTSKAKQIISPQEEILIVKISTWLKPNGILLFNRPSHTPQSKIDTEKFAQWLDDKFGNVYNTVVEDTSRKFVNTIIKVKIP
jgi:spermidine synthase